MSTPKTTTPSRADYGPRQFPDRLGLAPWEFERALTLGVIPPADVGGRWSAAVVEDAAARIGEIRVAVGTWPDMGATRAAERLTERFGLPVAPDAVAELHRTGHLPRTGSYKGHPLYDGLALERFTDRAALEAARRDGRLLDRTSAARHLGVRDTDFTHLIGTGLLHPATYVHSRFQPRSHAPAVPLYRHGDLQQLLTHPGIDWEEIRTTPKGRPSPLAHLPTASPSGGGSR
ncbi:hypothetical protein [Streptomyces sp. NPDC126503]|uniref:hypothetical protein n=1 Tax=Streptomyces sp. NPDC126503 TaxID=3155315 RepID=UPI0033289068